jgi:hypothetical protein
MGLPRSQWRKSCEKHPDRKHYARGMCMSCYEGWKYHKNPEPKRKRAIRWYAANQERVHLRDIARKFGLAPEEYQAMLDKQNGLCALCEKPPRFRTYLCVDHCHAKQKARALLCVTCNAGLGQFYDDPVLLEKAAAYLRSHAG